jgi:hypothetical protein
VLITDSFVMLNFPKTGSSFARKLIKEAYSREYDTGIRGVLRRLRLVRSRTREVMSPHIDDTAQEEGYLDQHGTRRQIPPEYRGRQIVTITREPVSRYESMFFFEWWKSYPPAEVALIKEKYPNFPDLTFDQYYEMSHDFARRDRLCDVETKIDLGICTIQFIQFYFENPAEILARIDNEYIDQEQWRDELADISFLRQENLREDLKVFLLKVGLSEESLAPIDESGDVNVSARPEATGQTTLSRENLDLIRERDRLLYRIFPFYDAP